MSLSQHLERYRASSNPEGAEGAAQNQPPDDALKGVKEKLHREIVTALNREPGKAGADGDGRDDRIREMIASTVESEATVGRSDKERVARELCDDMLGLGPLEPLLADPTVSEIMVNGHSQIYVERRGKLELTGVHFEDDNHIMTIVDRIVSTIGRHIDEASPMVDARLLDGSRVNVIIPPLSLKGPVVTIRKFAKIPLTIKDIVSSGSLTPQMAHFLECCIRGRINVVVSGGTGSGKTTLLNILSTFIPDSERIVTIEDAAELQLRQSHVVPLESRPANHEGKGQITIRELVRNALRMRPDRIIVGEVRSGEALDMLQAMNTGHDGSLTTAHANSPRDLLSRLETMVLMAGMELPLRAIREQIASAIDIIVQQSRFRDGSRKIVKITEVTGMEGDVISLQDLFSYETDGAEAGKGRFRPTGILPKCAEKLRFNGITVNDGWFSGG